MYKVIFRAGGASAEVRAAQGETLLCVAQRAGVILDAPCAGNGACGKCRVRRIEGKVATQGSRHLTREDVEGGWMLACESCVAGDAVIEVPGASGAYQSGMRMEGFSSKARWKAFRAALEGAGVAPGNDLARLVVTLDAPTLGDALPDNERLASALQAQTGAESVEITYPALRKLARLLRQNGFSLCCILEGRGSALRVLDVLPPNDAAPIAGLAIDLGTTSVAGVLADMETGEILAQAAVGNGQIRYGADVISRMIEAEREGGSAKLQRAALDEGLRPLIEKLCAAANLAPERIFRACLAGNTAMNHLLLGLDTESVRMEPYVPTFLHCDALRANDIGLELHPEAKLFLAPNVGSYVGGDITAGVLPSMLWNAEESALLIDLGTNGELVFGNRDYLLCCACSAGPAFEGGDISCGMRAAEGAIDACTIDENTLKPTFTVIGGGAPAGLCGSGLIDVVAELFRTGAIDGKGRFRRSSARIRRDGDGMGAYVIAFADEADGARDVVLTEADIDSFIRAKGAIFSAVMTMLGAVGMDAGELTRVYIAGGIGSGINMRSAIRIGMLPDLPEERFQYIGNTSLIGATAMLCADDAREKVAEIARNMTYLELSTEPGYMDEFIAACFLPHTHAHLFPSVT